MSRRLSWSAFPLGVALALAVWGQSVEEVTRGEGATGERPEVIAPEDVAEPRPAPTGGENPGEEGGEPVRKEAAGGQTPGQHPASKAGSATPVADGAPGWAGGGKEPQTDSVLDLLGRNELSTRVGELGRRSGNAPGGASDGAVVPGGENPAAEAPDPGERQDLPDGEGELAVAALLPDSKAGDGPGVVEGVVFDAGGKGIPGVIVVVPELGGFKVRASSEGSFRITGLPATGVTFTLMKSAYLSREEVVQVNGEGVTKVRIPMELKPVELAEGEYNLDSREVLLDYEENQFGGVALGGSESASLVSGIGKEEFSKQNVSDAADAIGKVSGANIVGGRYAVIRGLADRYVTTMVNGALVSSADPSRKAVQLDLFPTAAIEKIDVYKTYSPDLPGDFGGGTIDIQFLRFPTEPLLEFNYKDKGNSELSGPFYTHPDRSLGFLADVNDPIPSRLFYEDPGAEKPIFFQGNANSPDPAAAAAWQELFGRQGLLPRETSSRPEHSYGATIGNTFEFGSGNKLGVVLAGQRKEYDSVNLGVHRYQTVPEREWDQDEYTRTVDWGWLASAGVQFGDSHTIGASYFRKRIADDNMTHGSRIDFREDGWTWGNVVSEAAFIEQYGAAAYQYGDFWRIDPVIRDLELFQLEGAHQTGDRGLKLEWALTRSDSSESRPQSSTFNRSVLDFADSRLLAQVEAAQVQLDDVEAESLANLIISRPDRFSDIIPNIEDPETITWDELLVAIEGNAVAERLANNRETAAGLVPVDPTLGQIPLVSNAAVNPANSQMFTNILTQQIKERTDEQRFALEYPIYFTEDDEDRRLVLSGGWRALDKVRTSRGGMVNLQFNQLDLEDTRRQGPDFLASLSEILAADPSQIQDLLIGQRDGYPFFSNGLAFETRNFDGESDLTAFYGMAQLYIDDWRFMGGARYEKEERSYFVLPRPFNALPIDQQDTGVGDSVTEAAILPALSIGRSFADESISVDLAWSQTVARPTFFEFMPALTLDQATQAKRRGNFFLTQSEISNLDLTVEWLPTERDTFRVGLFHKVITDPIVEIYQESVGTISFANGEEGVLNGLEFEFRRVFDHGWSIAGNYTYIDATLEYYVNRSGPDDRELVTVRFPYQPEHIFNCNLGYDHEESGWGFNLIYNFTGAYPTLLRNATEGSDIVQDSQHLIDVVVRRSFDVGERGKFVLSAGVENIFDSDQELSYSSGAAVGRVSDASYPGRRFFVGGKLTF